MQMQSFMCCFTIEPCLYIYLCACMLIYIQVHVSMGARAAWVYSSDAIYNGFNIIPPRLAIHQTGIPGS